MTRVLWSLLAGALLAPCAERPIPVLILTGASDIPGHDWRATTAKIREILEQSGRFTAAVAEKVPGLKEKDLRPYRALILNYNGPRWGAETERAVEGFVRSGRGFVSLHGVTYGVFYGQEKVNNRWVASPKGDKGWPAYSDLIGATWKPENIGHGARHVFRVRWTDREHPIAKGLPESFEADDELYHRLDLRPQAKVLAVAYSDPKTRGTGKDEPIIWCMPFGRGRAAHMTLGHDVKAYAQTGVAQALIHIVEWAATGRVAAPR
jgi:type 1 glutamine amidotransferase